MKRDTEKQYLLRYVAAITAAILTASGMSCMVTWSSPALDYFKHPEFELDISDNAAAAVTPLLPIGSMIGYLIAPTVLNNYRQKWALLIFSIPQLISWILIIIAKNGLTVCAARALGGIGYAGGLCSLTIYLSEISSKETRGIFLAFVKLFQSFGIFFTFLIDNYFHYYYMNIIIVFTMSFFTFVFLFMPDSSYFHKKETKGEEMVVLNGPVDTEDIEVTSKLVKNEHKERLYTKNNINVKETANAKQERVIRQARNVTDRNRTDSKDVGECARMRTNSANLQVRTNSTNTKEDTVKTNSPNRKEATEMKTIKVKADINKHKRTNSKVASVKESENKCKTISVKVDIERALKRDKTLNVREDKANLNQVVDRHRAIHTSRKDEMMKRDKAQAQACGKKMENEQRKIDKMSDTFTKEMKPEEDKIAEDRKSMDSVEQNRRKNRRKELDFILKIKESNLWKLLTVLQLRKAIVIVTCCTAQEQFSGYAVIRVFTHQIFSYDQSLMTPGQSSILLATLKIIASIICTQVIEKIQRKALLLFTGFFATLGLFVTGFFFFLESCNADVSSIGWLPLFGIILYDFSVTIGITNFMYIYLGELFVGDIKYVAVTVCNMLHLFFICFNIVLFDYLEHFGIYVVFWFYAINSAVFGAILLKITPETRGSSLEEIQFFLKNKQWFDNTQKFSV